MTPFALAFMALSMISVTILVAYCYVRILRGGSELDPGTGGPDRSA
ncbi:MAG: hypothetical protein ACE5HF_01765 [Gemmatimonadota bacterium]